VREYDVYDRRAVFRPRSALVILRREHPHATANCGEQRREMRRGVSVRTDELRHLKQSQSRLAAVVHLYAATPVVVSLR
jgi:hypothetical protein